MSHFDEEAGGFNLLFEKKAHQGLVKKWFDVVLPCFALVHICTVSLSEEVYKYWT